MMTIEEGRVRARSTEAYSKHVKNSAKQKEWRKLHPDTDKAREGIRVLMYVKYRDIFIFKKQNGCSMCDENDLRVLDFHHRNRKEKVMSVREMMGKRIAIDSIWEEIKKCDLLCSNHHRKTRGEEIDLNSIPKNMDEYRVREYTKR